MIENRLDMKGQKSKPGHFLLVNPYTQDENIFVSFGQPMEILQTRSNQVKIVGLFRSWNTFWFTNADDYHQWRKRFFEWKWKNHSI